MKKCKKCNGRTVLITDRNDNLIRICTNCKNQNPDLFVCPNISKEKGT